MNFTNKFLISHATIIGLGAIIGTVRGTQNSIDHYKNNPFQKYKPDIILETIGWHVLVSMVWPVVLPLYAVSKITEKVY